MKKLLILSIFSLLFILIAGGILWFGGVFSKSKPSESISPPPPPANQGLPALPQGYTELHENNPNMRPDRREAYLNKFNETIAKIKEHPDSIVAWYELGSVKDAFDDHKGAEEAWLFALKLAPNYTAAYNNLAQLYWRDLRDVPKAEKMFLKFLEFDPTATYIWRDLSDLYRYDYKNMTKAEATLLSGLEKNKNDPDLLSYLAVYYKETGKLDLAIKYYEELLKVAPANTKAAVEQELADLKAKHPPNQ